MTTYDFDRFTSLKADREAKMKAGRAIIERAQAEKRDINGAENAAIEASMAAVKTIDVELKEQSTAMVAAVLGGEPDWSDEDGGGMGSRSVFSESAKAGIVAAVKSRTAFRTDVNSKAALTVATLLPPGGTWVEGGLYPNTFPLASLFRAEQANGPTVRTYVFGQAVAGAVPEGGLKPDSGLSISSRDTVLQKIATTVRFSDEFSEDAPFLLSFLARELTAAVITRENEDIMTTLGATVGIGSDAGATEDTLDVVADAIASMEALNGATPTAVIVHPSVMAVLRKSKSPTQYTLDPLTGGPTTVHGVRVVSTPGTAAGTAWVVGGEGVVIYRRGAITAEIGMNADDFMSNMRTMRVEERFATAVIRPSYLTQLSLTPAA